MCGRCVLCYKKYDIKYKLHHLHNNFVEEKINFLKKNYVFLTYTGIHLLLSEFHILYNNS